MSRPGNNNGENAENIAQKPEHILLKTCVNSEKSGAIVIKMRKMQMVK